MCGVAFRLRKYGKSLGQSFSIFDNGKPFSSTPYAIGDAVSVMFEVDDQHIAAVNSLGRDDFRLNKIGMGGRSFAHIPCKVVSRDHAIAWEKVGQFHPVTTTITLEATSGYWEDLLVWIATGEKPLWAEETDH